METQKVECTDKPCIVCGNVNENTLAAGKYPMCWECNWTPGLFKACLEVNAERSLIKAASMVTAIAFFWTLFCAYLYVECNGILAIFIISATSCGMFSLRILDHVRGYRQALDDILIARLAGPDKRAVDWHRRGMMGAHSPTGTKGPTGYSGSQGPTWPLTWQKKNKKQKIPVNTWKYHPTQYSVKTYKGK